MIHVSSHTFCFLIHENWFSAKEFWYQKTLRKRRSWIYDSSYFNIDINIQYYYTILTNILIYLCIFRECWQYIDMFLSLSQNYRKYNLSLKIWAQIS